MQTSVLVADDDDAIRELLVLILSDAGYTTLGARDGRAAVQLAFEQMPDIAILDVMMPIMGGFEACRILKNDLRTADMPVLLLTSLAQTTSKVQGLDEGATDYITKPFENQELLARIRTALSEKNRRDILTAEALTDPLTGLTNRRGLEQRLDQLLSHVSRTGETLSILLFDADHFKQVNDTYGHDTGDSVLIWLAARAQETMRSQDVVGRHGGEEFLAILPSANRSAAFTAAERLRLHIANSPIMTPQGSIIVTVSVGVATYTPGLEIDPQALVVSADQALYSAKGAGRNTVIHIEGRPTAPLNVPEPPEAARGLIEALRLSNADLAQHSENVAALCWRLSNGLNMSPEERIRVSIAGLLHAIGVLVYPETPAAGVDTTYVLEGRSEAVAHAALLMRRIPSLSAAEGIVASLQERWDGSGTPRGMRGDEIPLGSRIVAVVDAYLTARRNATHEAALEAMTHGSGHAFDPAVVSTLTKKGTIQPL